MEFWQIEIEQEQKQARKKWNGKVITTGRQWANNASGAVAVSNYESAHVWDAVRDYYNSREWN